MKKILVLMVMGCSVATAQNRANVWEFSYTYAQDSPKCELKYLNGIMDTSSIQRVMSFFISDASICDTNGNLLFYSNGLTIGNRNYDTLYNAVNFNPGWATDFYEPEGMGTCQGTLILPAPASDSHYYIFHETGEHFIAYNTYQIQPLHLSYSVVDMNLDDGLGGVVDTLKNKYVIEDTLLWGGLTAVKHGNSRDWWVIAHRFYTNKYYKFLLTPYAVEGPFEQSIGSDLMYDVDVEATFSPEGDKYCISNYHGWFDYMSFDRCTGEFSNPVTVFSPDSAFYGSSFSPSGRYIYASSLYNLYQYDTWDTNMIENVIHIASWDSFVDPIHQAPIWFFIHQLAPDGRIYLSTWYGSLYLNVITSPDSLGLNCNFQPHSFVFSEPDYNGSIPSFPNYDLGALEGSLCDTLSVPVSLSAFNNSSTFKIAPNPTSSWLNIVYSTEHNATLTIINAYGIAVKQLTLYPYFKNRILYVDDLAEGIYLVTLHEANRIASEKLIIQR